MSERGVVKPPNQSEFSTNRAANGSVPLTREASRVRGSNEMFSHGMPGGSGPLARSASPISPPNNTKFDDGDPGYTPRPASAVEPGKGTVPVNPFLVSGSIVPASTLRDSAKK